MRTSWQQQVLVLLRSDRPGRARATLGVDREGQARQGGAWPQQARPRGSPVAAHVGVERAVGEAGAGWANGLVNG